MYIIKPTLIKENSEKSKQDIKNDSNKHGKNRSRSMNKPPLFSIDQNRSCSSCDNLVRRSSPSPTRKNISYNKRNSRNLRSYNKKNNIIT